MDPPRLPTLSLWLRICGDSGTPQRSGGEAELLATRTGAALLRALDRREEEVIEEVLAHVVQSGDNP